jgi:hypothetical protein
MLPFVAVVAALGVLLIAAVSFVAFAQPRGPEAPIGVVLQYDLGEVMTAMTNGAPVFCDWEQHVCIPRPLEGEPLVALFMYDTTPRGELGRGCSVPVRSGSFLERTFGVAPFGYRDPCTGSTYDRLGRHVFGPAPRDLDRLQVTIEGNEVVVDTSAVTCSPPRRDALDYGCPPARLPD